MVGAPEPDASNEAVTIRSYIYHGDNHGRSALFRRAYVAAVAEILTDADDRAYQNHHLQGMTNVVMARQREMRLALYLATL